MLILILCLTRQAARPDSWTWVWKLTGQPVPPPADRGLLPPLPVGAATDSGAKRWNVDRWHPELRQAELDRIRDDTYFRDAEHDVWWHLIALLKSTPDKQLQDLSLGPVSFLQIYRQTPAYRGRLVDLRGTIRRAHRVSAPENDLGVDGYWVCWLFPDRAAQHPIVVYLLDFPASLRTGMKLDERVQLTGFVYKRWSYRSAEGLAVAPVIMARTATPERSATAETASDTPDKTRPTPGMLLGTGVAAIVVTWLLYRYTSRRSAAYNSRELPNAPIGPPEESPPARD